MKMKNPKPHNMERKKSVNSMPNHLKIKTTWP